MDFKVFTWAMIFLSSAVVFAASQPGPTLPDSHTSAGAVLSHPVDPSASAVPPIEVQEGDRLLSEYCSMDCTEADPSKKSEAHYYCWVPSDGMLAVVPFSAMGENVCEAKKQLCLNIRSGNPSLKKVSREPDDHAYLCKIQPKG